MYIKYLKILKLKFHIFVNKTHTPTIESERGWAPKGETLTSLHQKCWAAKMLPWDWSKVYSDFRESWCNPGVWGHDWCPTFNWKSLKNKATGARSLPGTGGSQSCRHSKRFSCEPGSWGHHGRRLEEVTLGLGGGSGGWEVGLGSSRPEKLPASPAPHLPRPAIFNWCAERTYKTCNY